MWFKNAIVYIPTRNFELNVDKLEGWLSEFSFPGGKLESRQRCGFVNPAAHCTETPSDGAALTHKCDKYTVITIKSESKIIPPQVVKKEVKAAIAEIEKRELRKARSGERKKIKEDVLTRLTKEAFTKESYVNLLFVGNSYLVVDAPSHSAAETAISLVRKAFGTLPVIPLVGERPVETELARWILDGEPAGFTLDGTMTLSSILTDEPVTIKYKNEDKRSEQVSSYLNEQMVVTEAQFDYQNLLTCRVDEQLALKGLRFSDELRDENDDIPNEDKLARFDADLLLMADTLRRLIVDIQSAFNQK